MVYLDLQHRVDCCSVTVGFRALLELRAYSQLCEGRNSESVILSVFAPSRPSHCRTGSILSFQEISFCVAELHRAMLSLNISSYSTPSGYQISELPKPQLVNSKDVIIRVCAASINPIDVKRAAGALKLAVRDSYVLPPSSVHTRVITKAGFRIKSGMIVLV